MIIVCHFMCSLMAFD